MAEPRREFRVFGPPGCGKTTWTAEQVRAAAKARGSQAVLVASFTKAAATELVSRNLPIRNIGTLHSLCYRQLSSPSMAIEHMADWNGRHAHLAMKGESFDLDDGASVAEAGGANAGDELMSRAEVLRARMVPQERWPVSVRGFYKQWTAWKTENNLVDFTDLIEMAIDEGVDPPGAPEVGFFDEAQDFTALELSLVRQWGEKLETILLVGDEDQTLYSFKGASPDSMMTPALPEDQLRILSQSYRVPREVHAVANGWVHRISRRQEKIYKPRDEDGRVSAVGVTWQDPEALLPMIESRVDADRSVMLLATCSYMLGPAVSMLRREGIPFHNPYRRKRGDWNPLASREGATTAVDRVLSFLSLDDGLGEDAHPWTNEDVWNWVKPLKATGILRRGMKKIIESAPHLQPADLTWLRDEAFADPAYLMAAWEGDLDWWHDSMLSSFQKTMAYAIGVARKRGVADLKRGPKVVVGTIHSVKGGEADTVVVWPDLSKAGLREWHDRGEHRDSIYRQMYVGVTRAKQELVIGAPAGRAACDLYEWSLRSGVPTRRAKELA